MHIRVVKLNNQMNMEEQKKWEHEIRDPNNNINLEYYKAQLHNMTKEIAMLKKQNKKQSINERQLLVKFKAFELERAEYHEKIVDQHHRI